MDKSDLLHVTHRTALGLPDIEDVANCGRYACENDVVMFVRYDNYNECDKRHYIVVHDGMLVSIYCDSVRPV